VDTTRTANQDACTIAAVLREWFAASARQLPWRGEYTPYHVWLAEIMLQQTTVATCIPRYEQFVRAFPSLEALAAASEEQVLSLWEGLGYYTRARNLLRCARIVTSDFGGRFPEEPEALRRLPGVGPYTAGAISAIAFDRPAAMVDANVRRVLGRLLGLGTQDPRGSEQRVWQLSLEISQAGPPRTVNQALMEIGALLCTANNPDCSSCPLCELCTARLTGRFDCYGSVASRAETKAIKEVCALARMEGRWLLARPADGRWRGMWEFPRTRLGEQECPRSAVRSVLQDRFGLHCEAAETVGSLRHRVTVYDISLHVVRCDISAQPPANPPDWQLVTPEQLRSVPLPSPMRRIAGTCITETGYQLPLTQEVET